MKINQSIMISYLILMLSINVFSQESVERKIIEKYNSYWSYNSIETSYLRTDSDIYFSGEMIHFNCMILDNSFYPSDEISKIVNVTLINADNTFNRNYTVNNIGGSAIGAIELPMDIPSGNYQLVTYTRFMENFNFESLSHRLFIYIQNLDDDRVSPIVKNLSSNISDFKKIKPLNEVDIEQVGDKFHLSISNKSQNLDGDYYMISEGLSEIQFITKVKAKKNKELKISVPTNLLNGQFQKLILVNSELEVIVSGIFFLESNSSNHSIQLENKLEKTEVSTFSINVPNSMLSIAEFSKSAMKRDSITFFKRIYRNAFTIPSSIDLVPFSFEELISSETLAKFSSFTTKKWNTILGGSNDFGEYKIAPERDRSLDGVLKEKYKGNFENVILKAHSFSDGVSMTTRPTEEGKFSFSLLLDNKQDFVYLSAFTFDNQEISEEVGIDLNRTNVSYLSDVKFYSQEESDSIINELGKFKYILSTLEEDLYSLCNLFWERKEFDQIVVVNDYQSLNSLEDFVVEVLPQVALKKTNKVSKLVVFNSEENKSFKNDPFLIVDNKIVKTTEELLNIPIDSISEIRVIHKNPTLRKFGTPFSAGVILLITKDGSYGCFDNRENRRAINLFHTSRNSLISDKKSEFFKKTILINPLLDGENRGIIKTNYELGDFQLNVETLTKDGEYIRLKKDASVHSN